jgi:hypothetical protein
MSECSVVGCANPAVEVVNLNDEGGPLMEALVCTDHALDLRAGGSFQFGERSEILMGDSLPLELVNVTIADDGAGQTVTLQLGRGPQITQTIAMRVGKDFIIGNRDDWWVEATIAAWTKGER